MERQEDKTRILVVDDQKHSSDLTSGILKQYGFETINADNGFKAIEIAKKKYPDIILMDVMMSGIDGFETCKRLKKEPSIKEIPVIFVTALSDPMDKIKGFEVGGADYILKPFHHKEVIARINIHLTLKRQKEALKKALMEYRRLKGLLPICAYCKRVRNDKGYWDEIEAYMKEHTDVRFLPNPCPECREKKKNETITFQSKIKSSG